MRDRRARLRERARAGHRGLRIGGPGGGAGGGREAEHPLHHGRRHRLDAAVDLPPRPDGRGDAEHRPHRPGRRDVHRLLRRAELHRRAQRLLHRHESAARRHDPAGDSRQPVLPAARHAGARQVPARSRLQHRRVRQEPPRRPHRLAADRARLPGVLGLPLSPRRDAGGELPRHQQVADRADRRAALPEHADPRPAGGPRGGRSGDHDLPDAAAAGAPLHVLRRNGGEPDLHRRGAADARAIEDRGRGDLGTGHRLPRPQRPGDDRQAVLRLVQPGAHAHHHRAVGQVLQHGRRDRRQGLGRQRSRHEADGRQHRLRAGQARGDGPARQHHHRLHHRQRRRDASPSPTAAPRPSRAAS